VSRVTDPLAPAHGARFVLERIGAPADDAASAPYAASVITANARADYDATLGDDGAVSLSARGPRATDELEQTLAMIAKLVARGAPARRAEGLPAWPARITRWRGPGRGS
jgi:hypothetical protein